MACHRCSHKRFCYLSLQSSNCTIRAVNFMQTKNINLQIANECCLSLKFICFLFLIELDKSKSLSLKQTESDKTNSLDIFGSFTLLLKGKSRKLGILQAFLQTLF